MRRTLWFFLFNFFSALRSETIMVTSDNSKIPCQGCLKTNSFLLALEAVYKSAENCTILLEDKTYNLDSTVFKAYLDANSSRSTTFTESLQEKGRDIFIRGNINQTFSELIFAEQPISLRFNKNRLTFEKIFLRFTKQFNNQSGYICFFCLDIIQKSSKVFQINDCLISMSATIRNNLWNQQQNYSIFRLNGPSYVLNIQNLTIENDGMEIFKNTFLVISFVGGSYQDRKILLTNTSFIGPESGLKLRNYFSYCQIEFNSVVIENIKTVEIIGFRINFLIDNSDFRLIYVIKQYSNGNFFLSLDTSFLLLRNFLLNGVQQATNPLGMVYVFITVRKDCDIVLQSSRFQQIYLKEVKENN